MLKENFQLEHVSTGQWFRREMQAGTPLGVQVREYVVRGDLVPDELTLASLKQWLSPELLEHGFLLDGFPRTRPQAEALDKFCAERKAPLDVVLYLSCPEAVILERITGRRVCSTCGKTYHVRAFPPLVPGKCDICGGTLVQREDDREEAVRNRLEFYRRVTEPLVDYYRESDRLVSLNAAVNSEAAYAFAARVLES
jgi:adenylate kinase